MITNVQGSPPGSIAGYIRYFFVRATGLRTNPAGGAQEQNPNIQLLTA